MSTNEAKKSLISFFYQALAFRWVLTGQETGKKLGKERSLDALKRNLLA